MTDDQTRAAYLATLPTRGGRCRDAARAGWASPRAGSRLGLSATITIAKGE